MTYSSLVSYVKWSPNKSSRNGTKIDTISIHCMAGNLSVETCGSLFANPDRKASSNYGIGSDGRIACYVSEEYRSWCTSSRSNDERAITIEVANTVAADPWPVSDAAYNSLIELLADVCKRNNIKKLLWRNDKSLIGQVSLQNMTVHRWFASKACPGGYLYDHHSDIAAKVNAKIEESEDDDMNDAEFAKKMDTYLVNLAKQEPASWSAEARKFCEENEIITGDSNGNKMYKKFVTREELAVMLYKAITVTVNMIKKAFASE